MEKIKKPQKIRYLKRIVPNGYHSTDGPSYDQIVQSEKFLPSSGEGQFLGDGVYFWEGSYLLALRWAIRKAKQKRCVDYAIIQATIDLGACLDLTLPEHLEILEAVAENLRQVGWHINDPIVINYLNDHINPLDSVRAVWHQGKNKVFNGSRFSANVQPIICVRNTARILEYRLADRERIQ